MSLDLEVHIPDGIAVSARIEALQAADASGRFGIWPNHERFLTVLVPCVLSYREEGGRPGFAAVDGGVLLLEGGKVSVVTRDAVVAPRIEEVADAAEAMLRDRREQEHWARTSFAELETMLLRELRQLEARP
jgi:F-type H+-transporting ATPase subunit epsilon